ncbi:MAG: zinc ribbon domain-containing protein [Clostridia bacterium]|nr:zinc ribbon domain-containing protein [Clostridia bacterium]
MKYCGFCGAQLKDEHKFCINCGKSASVEEAENEKAEAPCECVAETEQINDTTEQAEERAEQTSCPSGKPKNRLKYSIMGFAFGVGALLFAIYCVIPILNLFVFLPAFIVFTSLSKKYAKRHIELGNRENGFYKAAKIVSTVAIPVGCVFPFLGLALLI